MASLRFYKYGDNDLKVIDIDKYVESIKRFYGDLSEREWIVQEDSILKNDENKTISFVISKTENKEFSTIEGLKEFSFIEYYPVMIFLNNNIKIGRAHV